MAKQVRGQAELMEQIGEIVNDFKDDLYADIDKAVTAGAEKLVEVLEIASPVSIEFGDHLKSSWTFKDKYKGVKYVGNTKTVKGKSSGAIPLSNILEYAERSPYKGFMQRTFNTNKEVIRQAIINSLKKGGN